MTSEQYYQMLEVLKNIDKTLVEIRDLTFANGIKPAASENVIIGIDTGAKSSDFSAEIPLVKQEEKPLSLEGLHWENPENIEVKKRGRKKKNEQA